MKKLLITVLLGAVSCVAQGEVTLTRVSETGDRPTISSDGRFVVFRRQGLGSRGGVSLKNLQTGQVIERVDTNAAGVPGNRLAGTFGISISADGRFVAFTSDANNLLPGDTSSPDLFVKNVETGEIVRISEDASGVRGNATSLYPSISADGGLVAFLSGASNLVPGDTNGVSDVFVKNLDTGEVVRISEDAAGVPGNNHSFRPSISADGRFVSFHSEASNLVPSDTSVERFGFDIFVKNVETGEIALVNQSAEGVKGNGHTFGLTSITADGQFVAFDSQSSNLVPNDTNEDVDVFVKNVETGEIIRASEDAAGNEGNGSNPHISADGRFVAFISSARLVPGDINNHSDVFVKNLITGEIERVSEGPAAWGGQSNRQASDELSISADGRFVAFQSNATNLIVGESSGGLFLTDVDGINAQSMPGNIDYAIYSDSAAEVFWDRVTNNGDYLYEITKNGSTVGIFDVLSIFDDELQPNVPYTYSVTPIDSSGNRLATAIVSFTTGDTEPSAPGNIRFLVYSKTAAEIFWDRSTDDGNVVGYEIIRNDGLVGIRDSLGIFEDDLLPGVFYTYVVTAIDNEGNRSETSTIRLRTDGIRMPVSGGPLEPTGLKAVVYSGTAAELFWNRPMTFGLEYEVIRDGQILDEINGVTYFDDSLTRGLTFLYEIVAINDAGERSAAAKISVNTDPSTSASD